MACCHVALAPPAPVAALEARQRARGFRCVASQAALPVARGSSSVRARSRSTAARAARGAQSEKTGLPAKLGLPEKVPGESLPLTVPPPGECVVDDLPPAEKKREGSNISTLLRRFSKVAAPYWSSEDKVQARWRLAGVFALSLGCTGVSVAFNFVGRDFFTALSSKDEDAFARQLTLYLGAFVGGIPVFVLRDYFRDKLALRWRAWMTSHYMDRYFRARTFYNVQSQSLVDNPDQRIVDDLNSFTSTALSFALALFSATIDLISFSGILWGIYPPLFAVLIVYSLGGTAISVFLGKGLVGLNFMQEKREADFRYGLVRVRENAESIAFYGGEASEQQLLLQRFKESFSNYSRLLLTTRNLEFFTSGYRYLIQLLPAAVVAPLFFAGKVEFGVINQSFSAFNHVLSDFSLIVYQFQSLSTFSAEVDRLGEFSDVLDAQLGVGSSSLPSALQENLPETKDHLRPIINLVDVPIEPTSGTRSAITSRTKASVVEAVGGGPGVGSALGSGVGSGVGSAVGAVIGAGMGSAVGSGLGSALGSAVGSAVGMGSSNGSGRPAVDGAQNGSVRVGASDDVLLEIEGLSLCTPQYTTALVEGLSFVVRHGEHLLIMGPSGSGKTSLLRAIAGLWRSGRGTIRRHIVDSTEGSSPSSSLFFVPQRPYMVLGTLRQQLLYPTWSEDEGGYESGDGKALQGFPALGVGRSSTTTLQKLSNFSFISEEGKPDSASSGSAASTSASSSSAGPSPPSGGVPLKGQPAGPPPSDETLIDVLEEVRLGHLLDRCEGLGSRVEWASVLSLGEQQRLAFARLLLSRPRLALMDESTSALDEDNETRLYRAVEAAGVTFVSVGHRISLRQFHTQVLRLDSLVSPERGRSWSLARLAAEQPAVEANH